MLNKYLLSIFLVTTSLAHPEAEWVSVERPEKVIHQLEQEEDRSIWVVLAKQFEDERLLLRFPEDPSYTRYDGRFVATATHLGVGEFRLTVAKKGDGPPKQWETVQQDADSGLWVFEKQIDTEKHRYLLRMSHPNNSPSLFRQYVDSFEIETSGAFHRSSD